MATVTWLDPLGAACMMQCLTLEEAYDYEAALEYSGVATNVHVSDPEWDLYMYTKMEEADQELQGLMDHMHFDHGAHVQAAADHYWSLDHAGHINAYWDQSIPF